MVLGFLPTFQLTTSRGLNFLQITSTRKFFSDKKKEKERKQSRTRTQKRKEKDPLDDEEIRTELIFEEGVGR
ncbi:hypothetical protein M0812_28934 [Anaeramoeba flamelloides]|uniref:Uncharacterized protein n=1 Tax=Anaeramoeba flamelloides TaxID=1746091 RepID=A0AAV7Y9K4_9EUKA|nr:hypothetical protein M0812_28934 [Anaeramoeba flamelloides]